ncbi:hypothetical protein GCM10029964_093300 [Kibdelosporangium lantanae]
MTTLNTPATHRQSEVEVSLGQAGLSAVELDDQVGRALAEDLRCGPDRTSDLLIAPDAVVTAEIHARRSGVLAGIPLASRAFTYPYSWDDSVRVTELRRDGDHVAAGDAVLSVRGQAHMILPSERTALNFLGRLSGVATMTARYVAAVAGTGCTVRDTRKTTPGLRVLEKYAVRQGGGANHRLALGDGVLIKDNHLAITGMTMAQAVAAARAQAPGTPVEIEIDTLEQLGEALDAGPDLVLLDNITPEQCARAVRQASGRVPLEASGGITLATVRAYAQSGVDFVAVGAVTHSARWLDLGLDVVTAAPDREERDDRQPGRDARPVHHPRWRGGRPGGGAGRCSPGAAAGGRVTGDRDLRVLVGRGAASGEPAPGYHPRDGRPAGDGDRAGVRGGRAADDRPDPRVAFAAGDRVGVVGRRAGQRRDGAGALVGAGGHRQGHHRGRGGGVRAGGLGHGGRGDRGLHPGARHGGGDRRPDRRVAARGADHEPAAVRPGWVPGRVSGDHGGVPARGRRGHPHRPGRGTTPTAAGTPTLWVGWSATVACCVCSRPHCARPWARSRCTRTSRRWWRR